MEVAEEWVEVGEVEEEVAEEAEQRGVRVAPAAHPGRLQA